MSEMVPRRTREQRAFRLAAVGGTSALVAAVGFVLALVSSFTWAVFFIAAVIAAICGFLFRRTVSG
jgi:putative flippase GtrA